MAAPLPLLTAQQAPSLRVAPGPPPRTTSKPALGQGLTAGLATIGRAPAGLVPASFARLRVWQ